MIAWLFGSNAWFFCVWRENPPRTLLTACSGDTDQLDSFLGEVGVDDRDEDDLDLVPGGTPAKLLDDNTDWEVFVSFVVSSENDTEVENDSGEDSEAGEDDWT